MNKFRVVQGKVTMKQLTKDGPGKLLSTKVEKGKTVYTKQYASLRQKRTKEGQIILAPREGFTEDDQFFESDSDMEKILPGQVEKVSRMYRPISDGLDDMTVNQLKEVAADEEIDLGNATTKKEIINIIRSAEVTA